MKPRGKHRMRMKTPSSNKDWGREVKLALEEALSIQEISVGQSTEVNLVDLYKMAPGIAAIYRSIENEEEKNLIIEVSWSSVLFIHGEIPEYREKHKRCFVHAYLDSMIYLKLITRRNAEKVMDRLEVKGVI